MKIWIYLIHCLHNNPDTMSNRQRRDLCFMNNIIDADFMKEFRKISTCMYHHNWHEKNGGNMSLLLSESEIRPYLSADRVIRTLPLPTAIPEMAGEILLITGTGKYMKNIADNPEENLGIIRVSHDGSNCGLLWGFNTGGTFTSEIIMHLGAHYQRRFIDRNQRVVMHAHPAHIIALTHIHSLDEKEFSKALWKTCTECIAIFPDGVGVLPWMVSSTANIGLVSAEKFKETNVVIWAMHGITVTGSSLDEAYGILETVDKAAQIYLETYGKKKVNTITDACLKQLVDTFHLKIKEGYLNEEGDRQNGSYA